jgi:hypothetical protein
VERIENNAVEAETTVTNKEAETTGRNTEAETTARNKTIHINEAH